jgi:hypothetical protein
MPDDPPLEPYCNRCKYRHSGACVGADDPVRPPN